MSLTQQSPPTGEQAAGDAELSALNASSPEPQTPIAPVPLRFRPWDTDSDSGAGQEEDKGASTSTLVALWVGPVALVLAGIGEYLLFVEASRGLGVALLVLAMLLGVVAFAGTRPEPDFTASAVKGAWLRIAWGPRLTLRLAGIGTAVCLSAGSVVAYLRDPQAIFGLQGALWLAGMVVLLLSCARWYPTKDEGRGTKDGGPTKGHRQPTTDDRQPVLLRIPHSVFRIPNSEGLVFAGLVALSLITHLAFLDQIPWRLHFDEGFAYGEIMRYYRGPAIPLFTTTWVNTGLPSLWFSIAALLMHITGPSLAGVRLGVALAGALTVLPVYGIGKLLAGRMEATLAAFAVAVSAVYIHYSRVSIINVTTPLAWAVCFYFLLKGLRSRRPGDFVWAGLAAGLSMYTYYGTRLLPYLLLIFLAYLLVFHFRAARERLGHIALVPIGFLAGFGPLIGYFILHPDVWASRGLTQLNIPSSIPTTWDAVVADWNILAPLLWQDFLGLSVQPGKDTVYWAPFLLPLEAALLVVGVGILIWRWRQPASFMVLLWGLGVILTGGLLIDAPSIPNFAHWTPAFPAFFLTLALPVALWWNALMKLPRRSARIVIYAAAALVVLLMALDLGANAYSYLVRYPPLVPADHSLEATQGRFAESVVPNTHVRVVGNTWAWQPLDGPIDEMMSSPGSNVSQFFNPSRELPIAGDAGRNLAFLFYNDMWDYLPLMESYYPGGTAGAERSPDGTVIAESYFVPAEVAAERYGVLATFNSVGSSSKLQWSGQVDTVGALPMNAILSYPLVANWTGAFYVADYEPVKLTVQGTDNAHLWVQGAPEPPGEQFDVQPGWVRFNLSARLDSPQAIKLLLARGSAPAVEIDRAHLWPTPLDQGLVVTLQGLTIVHRIDPFIGAGALQPLRSDAIGPNLDPDAQPFVAAGPGSTRASWEGQLQTSDGLYTMEIRSDAAFQLTIDGKPVIKMCAAPMGNQVGNGQVQLTAGWHDVRIDYQVGGANNRLEWFWVRPDGVREVVPPAALRIGPHVSPTKAIQWPVLPAPVPCQ